MTIPDRTGLGLPADGPGALAGLGRRIVALVIDWGLALLISNAFFGADAMATLGVFAAENVVLVGTAGATAGHLAAGLVVRHLPADGAEATTQPGLGAALIRTVLLCLVIPAVIWDADGRGMHDRLAGTVLIRRR